MEHGSELACIAAGCLVGVEHHLVAGLLAVKFGSFLFVLEIEGEHYAVGYLDGTFVGVDLTVLVELHERAFHHCIGCHFLAGLL